MYSLMLLILLIVIDIVIFIVISMYDLVVTVDVIT